MAQLNGLIVYSSHPSTLLFQMTLPWDVKLAEENINIGKQTPVFLPDAFVRKLEYLNKSFNEALRRITVSVYVGGVTRIKILPMENVAKLTALHNRAKRQLEKFSVEGLKFINGERVDASFIPYYEDEENQRRDWELWGKKMSVIASVLKEKDPEYADLSVDEVVELLVDRVHGTLNALPSRLQVYVLNVTPDTQFLLGRVQGVSAELVSRMVEETTQAIREKLFEDLKEYVESVHVKSLEDFYKLIDVLRANNIDIDVEELLNVGIIPLLDRVNRYLSMGLSDKAKVELSKFYNKFKRYVSDISARVRNVASVLGERDLANVLSPLAVEEVDEEMRGLVELLWGKR